MEFKEVFFTIIVPALTAVLAGYGVGFLARMRASTREREFADQKKEWEDLHGVLEKEQTELKDLFDNRGRILTKIQEDLLEPLDRIIKDIDLETTIGFETKKWKISKTDEEELVYILKFVKDLKSVQVEIKPSILAKLGLILSALGKLKDAETTLCEALDVDGADHDTRANLANVYLKNKKYTEAAKEFETLIELARHRFDAHFGYGLTLVELKKFDEGVNAFSKAIRFRPEHARSYCELGNAQMLAGELDRAMESARVALKLSPDIYEGHLLLQQLFTRTGKFDEAIKECRKFLSKKEDAEVYYNLATAYALSGNKEQTLKELHSALRFQGDLRFRIKDDQVFSFLRDSRRFRDLIEGKPGLF